MKLTCRCGASIEISGDRFSETEIEQWNKFWVKHEESCGPLARGPILRWTCPEPYEFTPEVLAAMAMQIPDPNLCQKCGGVIIPVVYRKGMMICGCKKPDPYQRFRDAMKEGKMVFHDYGDRLVAVTDITIQFSNEDLLLIEGVDIPKQPTQEWLDKNGVELTGECRPWRIGDMWAGGANVTELCGPAGEDQRSWPSPSFSGRRWIVKRKAKDDGFEKWFTSSRETCILSKDGLKGMARYIWTAAQEAAKK